MKNIKSISYSYSNDFKNPINYYIQTDTVTTSLDYKDALKIAYSVIDSLGGNYDFLDELVEAFEEENSKEIKCEAI